VFEPGSVDSKAEKRPFLSNKINGSRDLAGSDPAGVCYFGCLMVFGLESVDSKAKKRPFLSKKDWNIIYLAGSDPAGSFRKTGVFEQKRLEYYMVIGVRPRGFFS
jgi:hypothetical protein